MVRSSVCLIAASVLSAANPAAADMLAEGARFPAWTLVDHTGATVRSEDLAGKTYLLWYYPKALTPGCTAEGCALRDSFEAFRQKDVVILGVSFDEPKDNAAFAEKERFPFRLLSDTERSLAVAVGAADSPKRMWARRISYLVGPDGTVLRAYADVDPREHAAEVLQDLEALVGN